MYDNKYSWVKPFKDVSLQLLNYRNNRKLLLDIMYSILTDIGKFSEDDEKNCNFDKRNGKRCKYDDFDPFSFMNRLAIYSEDKRSEFIQRFSEKTHVRIDIPTDYNGVPSVNPQKSCMLCFGDDRQKSDVDDLWELFEAAIKLPADQSLEKKFVEYYNLCLSKPNCKFNLSSCLFRMDATYYISLDETNRKFIEKEMNIKINKVPDGKRYLDLLKRMKSELINTGKYTSFADFSYHAYLNAQSTNTKNKVWLYAPGEAATYWDDCINDNAMYIGWDLLGDLTTYESEDEIYDALKEKYDLENPIMDKCACYDFANNISIGDTIIVKSGELKLLGYGTVTSDYYYDDNREKFKHKRNVNWLKVGDWINKSGTRNPKKTLTEISQYPGYPEELLRFMNGGETMSGDVGYYFVNARPKFWSFSKIKVGDVIEFSSTNHNGNKRSVPRNYVSIKPGDKLIAYESTPVKAIVGLCEVVSKDKDNNIVLRKTEHLINTIPFSVINSIPEIQDMEYLKVQQGSLFKLTKNEYDYLYDMIREINPISNETHDKYTESDFLKDVYIKQEKYRDIVGLLDRKKNIILQGPPGVGKTFMAKRLAYSIIGEKNPDRIEFIQFHQSYSYEDFIEGFRPSESNEGNSFEITKGVFYNFCLKAKNDPNPDNKYFMIIDEINRGNLSKIFGELLMLIEKDKRDESLTLAYSKSDFSVPKNLYIIGMMNTADRSLAILDYALRRRFSFVDVEPAFENNTFKKYIKVVNNSYLNKMLELINALNLEIKDDPSLGKGFMIGHSYFCDFKNNCSNDDVKSVVKYDILPMIREYWFDDESKVSKWEDKLLGE